MIETFPRITPIVTLAAIVGLFLVPLVIGSIVGCFSDQTKAGKTFFWIFIVYLLGIIMWIVNELYAYFT